MSAEQEAAAKWQVIEDYKKTKEAIETLEAQISRWQRTYSQIATTLMNPSNICAGQSSTLPTTDVYDKAAREAERLGNELNALSARLKGLGVELV